MQPVKAVIAGILVDVLGTTLIAILIGFVSGFYLLSQGVSQDDLEAALIERLMQAPWNVVACSLGAAVSVLAGYVTAAIAKTGVYYCAGIVGAITGMIGYWNGFAYYSTLLNRALAVLAIVATVVGAFLWLRRPPLQTFPGRCSKLRVVPDPCCSSTSHCRGGYRSYL